MNRYQTLAANTALISIGTFGSKLLVFLMVRFYTGYLTPAEYGTADLITQTANLLIPIASLDVAEGVFRFAADRREQRAEVFTIGVYTMLFAAARAHRRAAARHAARRVHHCRLRPRAVRTVYPRRGAHGALCPARAS